MPHCVNDSTNMRPSEILRKDLDNLLNNVPMESMNDCLRPCKRVIIQMIRFQKWENRPVRNKLYLVHNNEVPIHTYVYDYDIFNLIVDLGSSLGLWLGLSALSIYDGIIVFAQRGRKAATPNWVKRNQRKSKHRN